MTLREKLFCCTKEAVAFIGESEGYLCEEILRKDGICTPIVRRPLLTCGYPSEQLLVGMGHCKKKKPLPCPARAALLFMWWSPAVSTPRPTFYNK